MMNKPERLSRQRELVRIAIGHLEAVQEYFSDEDFISGDLEEWNEAVSDFENWALRDSPLGQ